ncbi:beta strand repeat-containing protein, partial [Flavobacterium sp. GSP11]|uniref:beta strand repeat-containing protein n=1 Tax=Flavobacterium sp. GSP11 TaxID=3401730 RepID=UPI003AAE10F8
MNAKFSITKIFSLFTLLFILTFNSVNGQTPGIIYEPATGLGATVLDPNGDGYVSLTSVGFTTDDQLQSEIPYSSLIFPMVEPNSDLGPGPDCGFTDFVDQGDQDPVQSYVDASNNWLFRMRMGNTAPNAKSYSILIDTDGKFGGTGPNADPNYSSSNPGFEIEIVLSTKFGVFVYDVNNMNCTPVISYVGTTNYQKSIALTTSCGNPDYFYDFFLNFSDLTTQFGVTPATKMRMAIVDNMAANKSTLCNSSSASDLAGIDDASCGSILENCFGDIVDNYTPCAPGVICPDRSVCPGINNINTGATSISGTSTEANGTIIDVYKDEVFIGSTAVSAGIWILSSISPALVTNNVITATATAPSKGVSIGNCNSVTVVSCSSVTTVPAAGDIVKISGNKGYDLTVSRPIGTIVRCYNANGVLIDPIALVLESPNNLNTVTTTSVGQHVLFKCQTGNCFGNTVYFFTYQEPGKCESSKTYDCQYSSATATANPTVITAPISTSTTSISGSMNAPDNVSGVTVNLMSNGMQLGTTTTTSGGAWTIGSLSLSGRECQTLSVVAIISGKCISVGSVTVVIQRKGITPVINGPICTNAAVISVSGTSVEAVGTIIRVYENGVAEGSTTTVLANGTWTASTGISIALGSTITAKASGSCLSLSDASNSVFVGTKSSNIVAITTTTIYECSASVSGTGTNGDVVSLYVDGFQIGGTTTVSGGVWTIGSLDTACYLYTGGVVTAKAATGTNCEGNPSAGVTVVCVNPSNSLIVTPASTLICPGSTVAVTVQSSESGIIYQLFNGVSISGSSKLGTGSSIILTSAALTSATTLTIKAIRLGNSCTVSLLNSVTVTIDVAPTTPATAVTQPTCATATGTITVAVQTAGETYSFDNGSTFQASNIKSGLATGSHNVIIKSTGGCNSAATTTVINAQPATPAAPTAGAVTQPTCSVATGSFQIASYNAADTYTFTPSVVSISGTGLVTANANSYTFTLTNVSGCTSLDSSSIVVNAQPATPAAPTAGAVTQPTCSVATGSFQIASYNAANTYTFTPSVVSISGTGLVTANANSYTFTLTNASGCTSLDSSSIVVNAQPVTPAAPTAGAVTQPTCSVATGSFQIASYNATNTYTFTPSVVSISGTGLVTANANSYTFMLTNVSGCTSLDSSSIVVNGQPATPSAPTAGAVTQPTCSVATGSFQIASYNAANTYTFTPSVVSISGTGLVTANANSYTFTLTNVSGCTSLDSSSIVVNAQPATPSAPTAGAVTQPTCSVATGSFQIASYNAANTYTFTPSVVSISGTGLVTANANSYT